MERQPPPAWHIFHLRSLVCFYFRISKKLNILIDSVYSTVVRTHKTAFNAATHSFLRHFGGRFDDHNRQIAYFRIMDLINMATRNACWDWLTSHARWRFDVEINLDKTAIRNVKTAIKPVLQNTCTREDVRKVHLGKCLNFKWNIELFLALRLGHFVLSDAVRVQGRVTSGLLFLGPNVRGVSAFNNSQIFTTITLFLILQTFHQWIAK